MGELTELEMLNLIAEESGSAKQLMRDAGFGVTGTNLLETTKQALAEIERLREIEWMWQDLRE